MTRFWLWVLLSLLAVVTAAFGLTFWSTTADAILFGGQALALHWLFGEQA